jgi:hypothetical protein
MTDETDETIPTQETIPGAAPARGYRWPPFEKGHTKSLVHGARSERFIAKTAREVIEDALEVLPWLSRPEFGAAVQAWARAEAKVRLLSAHLAKVGVIDPKTNEARSTLTELGRWEKHAADRRRDLGLDPHSLVRLEAEFASARRDDALAEQISAGHQLVRDADARDARQEIADASPAPLSTSRLRQQDADTADKGETDDDAT